MGEENEKKKNEKKKIKGKGVMKAATGLAKQRKHELQTHWDK